MIGTTKGHETARSQPYQTTSPVWETWHDLIPHKPYCTDDLASGLIIRPRSIALRHAYLQLNPPGIIRFITLDIDRADAALAFEDANLPAPNFICQTPHSGHAHITYMLGVPVPLMHRGAARAFALLAAVTRGLTKRLGADRHYAGLMTKNPASSDWRTSWLAPQPYTLIELVEWLDPADTQRAYEASPTVGIGRNCQLFDDVRQRAYAEARGFHVAGFQRFSARILDIVEQRNLDFAEPLPFREVRSIARSIAKWTWERFTPERFSEIQSQRRVSFKNRRNALLDEIAPADLERMSTRDIAEFLGCSERTARRYRAPRVPAASNTSREQPWVAEGISRATWYRRQKDES